MLFRSRLDRSRIHGTGVFADEAIAECQLVWRYDPVFDRRFSQAEVDAAGPAVRDFLTTYAYRSSSLDGGWLLSGDHARIRRWRLKQALGRTWLRRPDLLAARKLNDEERGLLDEFQRERGENGK